ncbi:MAG: acyl-CoA dehydrogenase [Sphingomonadales bacterium]|nr:acyl-CoA dehydrogenase [Sphingomonadales bacterium]
MKGIADFDRVKPSVMATPSADHATRSLAKNEHPLAVIRSLAPVIEANAALSESGGTLAPDVVAAFRETNLFWLLVPRELGGLDVDVVTALAVWEEASRADGSSGWSLMANCLATGIAASFLGDDAVKTMFVDDYAIAAGMAGPGGTAVAEANGYRGSGKYQFGSGCMHANWFCAGMMISDGKGGVRKLATGGPEVQVCFLPRDQIEIKPEWDVFGLSGTGSIDYEVKDRFIPLDFTTERTAVQPREGRGRGTFRLGVAGLGIAGHTAVALGLAKRALEEISRIAERRKRPHYSGTLSEHPVFRHDFALHEASYRAARALAFTCLQEAEKTALSVGSASPLQLARLRQMVVYVHNVASDVVRFCHVQGGSDALRNPSILGRCMRDMHAATQHVFVDTTYLVDAAGPLLEWHRSGAASQES